MSNLWIVKVDGVHSEEADLGSALPGGTLSEEIVVRYAGQERALMLGFYLEERSRDDYEGMDGSADDVARILSWGDNFSDGTAGPGLYLEQKDHLGAWVRLVFKSSMGADRKSPLPFLGVENKSILPNHEIELRIILVAPSDALGQVSRSMMADLSIKAAIVSLDN